MTISIKYNKNDELPKLAWVASFDKSKRYLQIFHGPAVEYTDTWMVEGVWDGEFKEGNFHRSENFFGSGVRIEGDTLYFASSTSLDDRLVYCFYENIILVSNSLIHLLGYTGATLDHHHMYNDCWSIENGILKYDKEFHIKHKKIKCFYQAYHRNIVYRDGEMSCEIRSSKKEMNSYQEYIDILKGILVRMRNNYLDKHRMNPMHPFVTLSTGYDSTAIAVLVKEIGVKDCFISKRSSSNIPWWLSKDASIDDGGRTAKILGLYTRYLMKESFVSKDEIFFLAASWDQFGTIFHSMAEYIENNCKTAVVFSGHNGDILWDVNVNKKHLNDEIMPGDLGGLGASEIRLKSGFIQISVPYILARSIESLNKIAHSEEMSHWRLNNSYDRPIPRRIAEEAGIPRDYFGQRNKAVAKYYYYPKNKHLRKDFFEYISQYYDLTKGFVYSYIIFNWLYYVISRLTQYLRFFRKEDAMRSGMRVGATPSKVNPFWPEINLYHIMFIWAVNTLSRKISLNFKRFMTTSAG